MPDIRSFGVVQGSNIIDSQVPLNSIDGVVFLKPVFTNMSAVTCVFKSVPGRPASVPAIYTDAIAMTSTEPANHTGWSGDKTAVDINLYAYGYRHPQTIAIAVHLDDNAHTDGSDYSFATIPIGGILHPRYAVTAGLSKDVDDDTFSWIYEDDFALGTSNYRRKTVVFACEMGGGGVKPYVPYNLGLTITNNADPSWSLPLLVDPKIKNDG